MITLWAIMSTALHNIMVTVVSSILVAGAVGYGTANFTAGEIKRQVDINTGEIASRGIYIAEAAGTIQRMSNLERRTDHVESEVDDIKSLIINGQKESTQVQYQILHEIAAIRKDTAINSTKIGSIEIDISDIKDQFK